MHDQAFRIAYLASADVRLAARLARESSNLRDLIQQLNDGLPASAVRHSAPRERVPGPMPIDDPHIVRAYSYCYNPPHYVMELVEGETLAEYLRKRAAGSPRSKPSISCGSCARASLLTAEGIVFNHRLNVYRDTPGHDEQLYQRAKATERAMM